MIPGDQTFMRIAIPREPCCGDREQTFYYIIALPGFQVSILEHFESTNIVLVHRHVADRERL